MDKLIGRLSGIGALSGKLTGIGALRGRLTIPSSIHTDYYEGPYEVTPRAFNEVVLETNDKTMLDDVTVLRVPYSETCNPFDGKTAYIASEV